MSFVKTIMVGYLGKDPALKYNKEGKAFCYFSVAASKPSRDKDGEKKAESMWFNATCVGNNADIAMAYLKKGHSVYLEGMPSTHLFTGSKGMVEISNDLFVIQLNLLPNQKAKSSDETEDPEAFEPEQYEQEQAQEQAQAQSANVANSRPKATATPKAK